MREIGEFGDQLGLHTLASFADNPAATERARYLLQTLPLDERSFNDAHIDDGVNFQKFTGDLADWCLAYRSKTPAETQTRHAALFGFLGLMLITVESLGESDRKRDESRSVVAADTSDGRSHDCRETCGQLIRDEAVQLAIKEIYRTPSAYSVRKDVIPTAGSSDWDSLDFTSLVFHRHGTTSIILRVVEVGGNIRALKLILFPFLRFQAIMRETRDYGQRYNPAAVAAAPSTSPPSQNQPAGLDPGISLADLEAEPTSDNLSSVVPVLASSERWILMKFINGITLAELLSLPELMKAKIANLNDKNSENRSFSELLCHRIRQYSEAELATVTTVRSGFEELNLDALLRLDVELARSFPDRLRPRKRWERVSVLRGTIGYLRTRMTKRKQDDRKPARAKIAGSVEWQWMFDAGNALFNAMKDLSALEVFSADLDLPPIHGDLTPSNIIVNNVRDLSVTLVDLGRNYFYTQALTGRGSSDSAFVAPEIREGGAPDPLSDVYSIGQLLQHIGYRGLAPHELVFDGYYDRTALVARFLEDLIQEKPDHRLVVFSSARRLDGNQRLRADYTELQNIHRQEIDAVMAADRDGHGLVSNSLREILSDIIHPWSRATRRQWNLWQQRKGMAQQAEDRRLRGYTRWLFLWSTLATLATALILGCVIYWFFRDIPKLSYGSELLALGQDATGHKSGSIPFIDSLRAADYHIPDMSQNWPARIVGFSYLLVGIKFYQGVLSGLMPLQGRRKGLAGSWAVSSEILMRLFTVAAPVLVATTVFFEARFWPIATAIGQVLVAMVNFVICTFAAKSIGEARNLGISTVGTTTNRNVSIQSFRAWVPSAAFYAAMVVPIAILIYVGVLHDVGMYAIAVSAINIFLFYMVKCASGGRDIRVGLSRGMIAAERVRIRDDLAERQGDDAISTKLMSSRAS